MSDAAHSFDDHVRKGARVNFAANLVINGAIAYALLRGHETLATFGDASYGVDLLITGFLLASIVAAIVVATHRRAAARGELAAPARAPGWLARAAGAPTAGVAVAFGAAGALASALVVAGLAAGAVSLSPVVYALGKGLWAGLLAAWIVRPAAAIGATQGVAARAALEAA